MSRLKLFKLTGALLAGKFVIGFMIGIIMAFYVEVLQHCINLLADQAHDFIRPVRYGKVSVSPVILIPPFVIGKSMFFSRGAWLPLPTPLSHLQSRSLPKAAAEWLRRLSVTVKKVLSYTLPKMRVRHDTNLLMECLFVDGWMKWTGACRWELIQKNYQTRTSEIQNTIKSSQGKCRLTNVVYARQCECKKYQYMCGIKTLKEDCFA